MATVRKRPSRERPAPATSQRVRTTSVRGNGADREAAVVGVEELALVAVRRHLIEVHGGGIALVGREEEALLVRRPALELGPELVARSQVADAAVRRLDVEVGLLVPSLIAQIEEALVAGEIAQGQDGAHLGVGELDGLAAVHGKGIGVEDSRLVRAHQDLAAVGRERRAAVRGVGEELVDGVLLRGVRSRCGLGGGRSLRSGGRRRRLDRPPAGDEERRRQTQRKETKSYLHWDLP